MHALEQRQHSALLLSLLSLLSLISLLSLLTRSYKILLAFIERCGKHTLSNAATWVQTGTWPPGSRGHRDRLNLQTSRHFTSETI